MKPLRPRRTEPARTPERGLLADFTVPSDPGNERLAMQRVVDAVTALQLETPRLERLKTAVAEATMRAIDRGSAHAPELGVRVRVAVAGDELRVVISDLGGLAPRASADAADDPGLALVARMVDELRSHCVGSGREVVLVVRL